MTILLYLLNPQKTIDNPEILYPVKNNIINVNLNLPRPSLKPTFPSLISARIYWIWDVQAAQSN